MATVGITIDSKLIALQLKFIKLTNQRHSNFGEHFDKEIFQAPFNFVDSIFCAGSMAEERVRMK